MNKLIKKRCLIIILLIILFFITVFIVKNILEVNNKITDKENKVCANDHCFLVEIADDSLERSRGLMERENLDLDKGMLFIFDQELRYSFWMKNTLIPLDMIWINSNKEVVYIEKNVQPCQADSCPSYGSDKEARYVLEINAGQSDQANIQINDKLLFEFK
jgi:hypothetical protein